MTHEELCKRAAKWLTVTRHCGVVLTDPRASTEGNETPDVIGLSHRESIVIEAKASRSDLLAAEDVPDGWGLLYAMNELVSALQRVKTREFLTIVPEGASA